MIIYADNLCDLYTLVFYHKTVLLGGAGCTFLNLKAILQKQF